MFREKATVRGELSGYIEEMVGNQKIVKAFGYEQRAQDAFEEINGRLYTSGVKSQFASSLTNPSTRFVNAIVYAVVGIVGAVSAVNGGIDVYKRQVSLGGTISILSILYMVFASPLFMAYMVSILRSYHLTGVPATFANAWGCLLYTSRCV